MTKRAKKITKYLAWGSLAVLVLGVAAPYFHATSFTGRIRAALEHALGRKVEIGDVRFDLFTGPGFYLKNVVIHEDPAFGIEPMAYVGGLEARPRFWSLFSGRLEFSSIRLEDASINLVKTGSASEPGHWNFESLLRRDIITEIPEIHVRDGRINFEFGKTKSVFYFLNTDLDISPPDPGGTNWDLWFSGEPARADRPAFGFGSLAASGYWIQNSTGDGRLNLDLRLEKSEVGEMIALIRGHHVGIHGQVSSRMHLTGPLDDVAIAGSMTVADIHRWDLMPPQGEGWPLAVKGRLNLLSQTLDMETHSATEEALPITIHFRVSNYLSQPQWGVDAEWNRFPVGPVLELARHMGAEVPPGLQLTGTLDGAVGYSGDSGLEGELSFHDTAVAMPDSPPVQFEQARIVFDHGHARLAPAVVKTTQSDRAQLQADYNYTTQDLDLKITTDSMSVAALHAQAALASVPWLEQVTSGFWSGNLEYRYGAKTGWSGKIELQDAQFPLPGLAEPLKLDSATAHIHGARVVLDEIVGRVGPIELQGTYHYEPGMTRPHRLHVVIDELNAAELEHLFMPTLSRSRGLIERALHLGRVPMPSWLRDRHIDGDIQIGTLTIAGAQVQKFRAHLLWDSFRVELGRIRGRLEDDSTIAGELSVNLRGRKPVYRLVSQLEGMDYMSGELDADSELDTSGIGAELLTNLRSKGTFRGEGMELASQPDVKTVSGSYTFSWAHQLPRIEFSGLQVAIGNELYTGKGTTLDDGSLLVQLTNGTKEMRMTGTLARLHVVEPVAPQ